MMVLSVDGDLKQKAVASRNSYGDRQAFLALDYQDMECFD